MAGAAGTSAAPAPLHIVVMAGQSNMVGYGTQVPDLSPKWREPIEGALIWQGGDWAPLRASGGYQKTGYGPELSFAQKFAPEAEGRLGLVKLARTGSSLAEDWAPDRPGSLFHKLVAQVQAAVADRPVVLRGVLWMQGEADAIEADSAAAYAANLARFVERLRLALAAPFLPFVAAVIDAPEAQCPHRETVRAAQADPGIAQYSSFPCDGLPKRRDGLHHSAQGISILGRRFAEALIAAGGAETRPRQVRRWLWSGRQYQAWYDGPAEVPGQVVVALPHAVAGDGFLDYGFGQKYFHGRNTACIYLRARESNWFQEPQVLDLAARIRAFLGPEARVVTYGASMGAYGALLLSGPLGAEKVLAIAPQFSIDRARVPWETRWKQAADRIGGFIHDIDAHIAPGARKIVFYDRLSRDRGQVDLFAADASWDLVNLPCASHQVLRFLQETGALKPLLADLFGPGPDTALIRARARANRRSSALYWLTLALYAQRRRPALARAALRRCAELGGPKKKIKRIWADLHAGGPALPAPRPDRIGA